MSKAWELRHTNRHAGAEGNPSGASASVISRHRSPEAAEAALRRHVRALPPCPCGCAVVVEIELEDGKARNRRGRPPIANSASDMLRIRVTPAQRDTWTAAAERERLSLSEWLRAAAELAIARGNTR